MDFGNPGPGFSEGLASKPSGNHKSAPFPHPKPSFLSLFLCKSCKTQKTPPNSIQKPQILYKPNTPPASLHPDFPSPTSPLVFLVFPEPGQELCGSLSSRIQLFLRRSGLGLPLERLHDVAGKRKTGRTHPKKPREGARRPLLPKSLSANPGSLSAPSPARRGAEGGVRNFHGLGKDQKQTKTKKKKKTKPAALRGEHPSCWEVGNAGIRELRALTRFSSPAGPAATPRSSS